MRRMFELRAKHWGMRALVSERNKIILPQVPSQFGWSKREGHQILLIRHHNPCFFVPIQGRCWIGVEADPEGVGVRVGANRSAEVLWLSSHRSDTFSVLLELLDCTPRCRGLCGFSARGCPINQFLGSRHLCTLSNAQILLSNWLVPWRISPNPLSGGLVPANRSG